MATHHDLAAVLDDFLELSKTITVLQVRAFLLCVTNEGATQRSIEEALGTTNATASRTLARWMEYESRGKPGYGFIRSEIDPTDRRYRIITLTPNGRAFASKLKERLKGAVANGD